MKWRATYHNNGDISFRLMPETDTERVSLNTVFSHPPGGMKFDPDGKAETHIERPVLSKDGTSWEGVVGDPTIKDGIFTRRIALGWKQ